MSNFCTNCGAKLDEGMNFCASCGEKSSEAWEQPGQPQQPAYQPQAPVKKKSKAPIFAAGAAVLIVVLVAALIVPKITGGGGDNTTPPDNYAGQPANNSSNGMPGNAPAIPGGVYKDEDGNTAVQNADGSIDIVLEDGSVGQYGGDWPENEFTKLLPKPDFTLTAAVASDSEFTVVFQDASVEQIKAYVEKVKSAGFTIDEEITAEEVMGMEIYTFDAENAGGYRVSVFSAMGTAGLTMEKP